MKINRGEIWSVGLDEYCPEASSGAGYTGGRISFDRNRYTCADYYNRE